MNREQKGKHNARPTDQQRQQTAQVPPEQSDDLFEDRSAQQVSSPAGDASGENKVATSLDDE